MKVSIIIVNYNTHELTLQCIKSIKESKPKSSYEVIVIDNASSDGSVTELRKLKKTVKIIENDKNVGFAKANNQGIKISEGKYKLLLNSDTEVTNGAIDTLVQFAESNFSVGAVVPKLLNSDGSIQASIFRFPTIWRNVQQWWLGKSGLLDKYFPDTKEPVEVDIAVMSAFLITPRTIENVGLLNEKYFMYYEDFDYCREIARAGLKIFYVPDAIVYHYHGASGKNLAIEDKQWYRLLEGSKIYHGLVKHSIIYYIQRSADIFRRRIVRK